MRLFYSAAWNCPLVSQYIWHKVQTPHRWSWGSLLRGLKWPWKPYIPIDLFCFLNLGQSSSVTRLVLTSSLLKCPSRKTPFLCAPDFLALFSVHFSPQCLLLAMLVPITVNCISILQCFHSTHHNHKSSSLSSSYFCHSYPLDWNLYEMRGLNMSHSWLHSQCLELCKYLLME